MMSNGELIVWGYHGTTRARADAILSGGQFRISQNPWEWLGDGVYFWQDAPHRARAWGQQWGCRDGEEVAVLRAQLRLQACLDLLDTEWADLIWDYAARFETELSKQDIQLKNYLRGRHELDAAFFNYLVDAMREQGILIQTVRAAIAEGEVLFEGSPIRRESHVQIAVRDTTLIDSVELV
jgi:hypothetical protein